MDAAWKVYVGDRRFDDNQISNLFLKLKYETVGRFTFDFRPIDGDESYMVVNNTLRIFWGDLHKLDGVIQRVDWDSNLQCYHVYGADIRGFLLDRVNTSPSTVSSYTSDVNTSLMYEGCDFPSNIWTGAGDKIGTYTFHYKLGIQNTIRITGATHNYWTTAIERGTVYEHRNGCLYDATKNWTANVLRGATLRFVSGACKNSVYTICSNATSTVCLRSPSGSCSDYASSSYPTEGATQMSKYGKTYRQIITTNVGFETGATVPWKVYETGYGNPTTSITTDAHDGTYAWHRISSPAYANAYFSFSHAYEVPGIVAAAGASFEYSFWAKCSDTVDRVEISHNDGYYTDRQVATITVSSTDWALYTATFANAGGAIFPTTVSGAGLLIEVFPEYDVIAARWKGMEVTLDGGWAFVPTADTFWGTSSGGFVPGCSRLGDIYEIVFASYVMVDPATPPVDLVKDEHIIRYNNVDDLSKHTNVITVRGS